MGSIFIGAQDRDGDQLSDDDLMEMSLDDLLNIVVVTSSKREEFISASASMVNVLNADEIEMLGFDRFEQVLEYVTGISSVNGEGNVFTTTTIRGNTLVNANTNTLLLVDGIPIASAYNGSFDLGAIPVTSIERVEVVKGSNSVLYGTNAINAVINVITKGPTEENFATSAHLKAGSLNTRVASLSHRGTKKQWSWAVFADTFSTDGETFTIKDEERHTVTYNNELQLTSIIAKVSVGGFKFHFQEYRRELPNYRTRSFSNRQENDETGTLFNASYCYDFSQQRSIHVRSNVYRWRLTKQYLPEYEPTRFYWDYKGDSWNTDVDYRWSGDQFYNLIGINYTMNNARRFKSNTHGYDIGKFNEKTKDMAFYLNGNYRFSSKWDLSYGARYYNSDYYSRLEEEDISLHNLSKRVGIVFQVCDTSSFKFLYGESFRVPSYFEKEVDSKRVKGNPNLQPEESQSIDFVYYAVIGAFQIDVNLYQSKIDEKITRVPVGEGVQQNQNIGCVTFRGLEVNTKFYFDQELWGFAGYSYSDGEDDSTGETLEFTYHNMATLGLSMRFSKVLDMSASVKYLDDWGGADQYFLANLRLNYQLNNSIQIKLSADNVLGETADLPEIARVHPDIPTIPKMSASNYFIGVHWKQQ